MTQKVEDLRVRRTRKLLQKALIELTIEKGFADVTVHDITERAMVNRSTFYRHYLDKYDLLSQYIEELSELIESQDGEASWADQPDQPPDQPPAGLVHILKHVQANADFYRVMLGKKGDPALCAESFRRFIDRQFRRMVSSQAPQADPSRPPIDLSVSYVLHAGIGAIVWWLENDQPVPPEQVAVWLNQLSMADISLSLGPNGKAAGGR
ncbi:MAG TPA: TetR/AcrR family transcriptional regulator C-terminal domain-containing protein [Anaerolineae bacterium]|nr:TetR/AcrR family transcriptional regulator C-terminal domain-containing protein [Anaerolineae bacterium]